MPVSKSKRKPKKQRLRPNNHVKGLFSPVDPNEPEVYFGYATERQPGTNPFFDDDEPCACMITSVTSRNVDFSSAYAGFPVKIGAYFVYKKDSCDDQPVGFGPFDTLEEAYQAGHEKFGAVRFKGTTSFF